MMSNNGKQIEKSLNNCMKLYKNYGSIAQENGEIRQKIKNIDDLENLSLINKKKAQEILNSIEGLQHQCKHHHEHHCHHDHSHEHHHHKDETITMNDILTNKEKYQLSHTHIHHPKGIFGKPVTWYSNITQSCSKGIDKVISCKKSTKKQIPNIRENSIS